MKQRIKTGLLLGVALSFCAGSATAQFPDSLVLEFDFEGFGNLITMSPPRFNGDVVSGDSRIVGAGWWIEIDDTGWPSISDPGARWDHIFSNFFVYNQTYRYWTAVFDQNTLPDKPVWEIDHPSNGTMNGTLVVSLLISDVNQNGVLDADERMFGTFDGTMMVMKYGTGNFAKYCGSGSYNGAFMNDDPVNWNDDFVNGSCLLNLINCEISTQEASWTAVKMLYR